MARLLCLVDWLLAAPCRPKALGWQARRNGGQKVDGFGRARRCPCLSARFFPGNLLTHDSTSDFSGHGVDCGLTTARRPHDWRGRSCMRRGTSRRQRGRLQAPAANDWQGLLPFRLCVRKAIVPDGATRHRQSPPRLVGLWQRDGGCRRLAVARRGGNQPAAGSPGGTGMTRLEAAAAG